MVSPDLDCDYRYIRHIWNIRTTWAINYVDDANVKNYRYEDIRHHRIILISYNDIANDISCFYVNYV